MKIRGNIDSNALGTSTPYYALLPHDYEQSDLSYPVLFLFHGLFGDFTNWVERTNIESLVEEHQLIVVMPDGSEGWYTDSDVIQANKYETYFFADLLPHVNKTFPVLTDRSSCAVAGLSMGGFGAFKFALKRPDLFAFAASFSGAFDPAQRSDESPGFDWEILRPSILKAFGPTGSDARRKNDLWLLLDSVAPPSVSELPFFYFDCGSQDGFLSTNQRLCASFCERKIDHEFREIAGGHDWDYWESRVPVLLQLAASRLSPARVTERSS